MVNIFCPFRRKYVAATDLWTIRAAEIRVNACLMLIEFKAPEVAITQTTLDQAAVYNTTVHAPYLILANGKQTVVARIDKQSADGEQTEQIQFLNHIPSWNQLLP